MGNDINYPDQPTYGEGLKEALLAQIGMATGQQIGDDTTFSDLTQSLKDAGLLQGDQLLGEALANIDTRIRDQYGKSEVDLLEGRLLGDITRAGEGGRYVSGQRFIDQSGTEIAGAKQIKNEDDQLRLWMQQNPDIQQKFDTGGKRDFEREILKKIKNDGGTVEDFAKWHRKQALKGYYQGKKELAQQLPSVGDYYDPASVTTDAAPQVLSQEDVYSIHEGGEGAIVDRTGGLLDVYGGDTKVRQYDPAAYEQAISEGKSEEEAQAAATKYGTAGFDPDTGEFQGLVPMQAQAQGYLNTVQREGDIADVELLGGRATDAIRSQGNIAGALEQVGDIQQQGRESTGDVRSQMLERARGLLSEGLSSREMRDIQEFSRAAGTAAGRARDVGRISSEVGTLMSEDRNRRMQNLGAAQSLLSGEMGMQSQELGQALQLLGAEQSTAADPMMAIIGRPSSAAPAAEGLLTTGAAMQQQSGPQMINPEAGLGYISNRAANQATMAAGQAAGQGSMTGGLLSGVGSLMAAPATGGGSLITNFFS